MKFYSSRDPQYFVSAEEAIVGNLCPKGGLYLPQTIPLNTIFKGGADFTLSEIGFEISKTFLHESFSKGQLEIICSNAFNFPAPLIPLTKSLSILDLTKGPSLAFKDFGARFMAECLAQIAVKRSQHFSVLTATSGDTGAAVAAALQGKPGINVTILYPKGRISPFQEGQMTKWGGNIKAVAVNGSFDDCQRLVKEAFSNPEISKSKNLVSANSINISRLLAQMVYYIHAAKKLEFREDIVFVVPSGNLGNLTAGIFASKYTGLDCKFVAAHNSNRTFPDYIASGQFKARESLLSVSNAMDVGAPSNFERLQGFFNSNLEDMKSIISAVSVSDEDTLKEMKEAWNQYSYLACPHTAVGLKAARDVTGYKVVLATAAPKKFSEIVLKAELKLEDAAPDEKVKAPSCIIDSKFEELLSIL